MSKDPNDPRSKRPTPSDRRGRARRPAHLPAMTSWLTADLHPAPDLDPRPDADSETPPQSRDRSPPSDSGSPGN